MPSHSSAHASRHHTHRSRSRSPHASSHHRHRRDRSRSRSPHRRHHHRSHHASRIEKSSRDSHGRHGNPSGVAPSKPVSLPLNARKLSKHDYAAYRPMFALYLDIQKQKILEDMDEAEIKGRWKSFVGKWNRGELAEGWYDTNTLQKAIDSSPIAEEAADHGAATRSSDQARRASPDYGAGRAAAAAAVSSHGQDYDMDEEDSEDEYGPAALPGQVSTRASRVGPTVPRLDDLEMQKESREEEQEARIEALRAQRKADRAQQKERLEELVPRADPGSRERQLEKKMDKTAAVRSFREAKSPGAEEIRESDLMGDDVDTLKARKREEERRKSERELRREEIMRAKAAEREERIAEYRSQEDQTMEMLQTLAKQRFGGGGY
ncbi:uncharacterized protein J3D65DRAFT_639504 [Phyllosticta citribraziliensis]|uniref:RNA helicase n=1 Tax=Phyllosticta citribraziliensis TaxID=989973 RepID=A0ABR1L696_9PEZI